LGIISRGERTAALNLSNRGKREGEEQGGGEKRVAGRGGEGPMRMT